jgi:hypothetical protein
MEDPRLNHGKGLRRRRRPRHERNLNVLSRALRRALGFVLFALIAANLALSFARAQESKPPRLTEGQLAQLLAPIALYPDALLAQVLMASTYPLDVVQAARWTQANPKVAGKALEDAMQKQPWDPSVKALTSVPTVLRMMNERLDWTQQLGDAFLAQQEDVMRTVQVLRARAKAAGSLTTTGQHVVTEKASAGSTVIVIEPAQPQVVYVPAYNPTIVYGTWVYAAYPPYYWYPPGYVATRALWFAAGVAVGHAIWGHCDWGHHHVSVNVTRYNQFNRTTINNPGWNHNPARRGAVPYRDPDIAKRYNRTPPQTAHRDPHRGRIEAAPARPAAQPARPPAAQPRPAAQPANRPPARPQHHASTGTGQPRSFDDIERGREVRNHSNRGAESRASAGRSAGGAGGARRGR